TRDGVLCLGSGDDSFSEVRGLEDRAPTCLAAAPDIGGATGDQRLAWCGTTDAGVYRSDDAGRSWRPAGLPGAHVMALTVDPAQAGVVWVGTEPSAVWRGHWRSGSAMTWERRDGLLDLPSSDDWSFPPRPETHHVRWIACHPAEPGRLWAAIEAGALIWTEDGGGTWHDRVDGSPRDTHELAIHPTRPNLLRVAAGDGYFESPDGGWSWRSPMDGLDVGYLRSVAVDPRDPEVVVVSAASKARSAYAAFRADGRLYRRRDGGPWERVRVGWPEPPDTIAPLLLSDPAGRRLLAADERGVHASIDGGARWELLAAFDGEPAWLRGLAVV
ncbi:MAG: hypothetical protein R3253_15100, partial [Longimicrobiales bacterium]|nr:hypothetical protein [Longimicrobiales bacterium]